MNCDIATSMTWNTVLVFKSKLRYVSEVLTAGIPATLTQFCLRELLTVQLGLTCYSVLVEYINDRLLQRL